MIRFVALSRCLVVLALLASSSILAPTTVRADEADPAAAEQSVDDGGVSPEGGEPVATEPDAGTPDEGGFPAESPALEEVPSEGEVPPVEDAPSDGDTPSATDEQPADEGAEPSETGSPNADDPPAPESDAVPDATPDPTDAGAAEADTPGDSPAAESEGAGSEAGSSEPDPEEPDASADVGATEVPPPRGGQEAEGDIGAASHSGAVVAHKVDGLGNDLPGACFFVFRDTGVGPVESEFVGDNCDALDGANDGYTTIGGLAPGDYLLLESVAPEGYAVGAVVPFSIGEVGEVVEVTVANEAGGATLTIAKLDATEAPLPGACFQVHADAGGGTQGGVVAFGCDFFDGTDDGFTVVAGLLPGAYVAVEIFAPTGYPVGAQQTFTIAAGQTEAYLEFVNAPGGATLYVDKVDQFGVPQLDVCFDVFVDAGGGALGAYVTTGCDFADGAVDGTTIIPGLLPGDYVLNEFRVPHGYQPGRFPVAIGERATEVVFTARTVPATAHVQVIVCYFATDGQPRTEVDVLSLLPEEIAAASVGDAGCVPGAGEAFELVDAATETVVATLTTSASGRAEADVPPGSYVLVEPGEGFVELGELVAGGRYTVLIELFVAPGDLPEAPVPTPGDPGEGGFGLLEVFVFDCTEGGEATQIVVSEPEGTGTGEAVFAAAETAAAPDTCEPGSATVAFDGSDEEIEIEVGLTFHNVAAGVYTITELCSEATAEFAVFAGETTKILIFDFGAPCAGEETPTPTPSPSPTAGAMETPAATPVTTLPSTGTGSPAGSPETAAILLAAGLALAGLAVSGAAWSRRRRAA